MSKSYRITMLLIGLLLIGITTIMVIASMTSVFDPDDYTPSSWPWWLSVCSFVAVWMPGLVGINFIICSLSKRCPTCLRKPIWHNQNIGGQL